MPFSSDLGLFVAPSAQIKKKSVICVIFSMCLPNFLWDSGLTAIFCERRSRCSRFSEGMVQTIYDRATLKTNLLNCHSIPLSVWQEFLKGSEASKLHSFWYFYVRQLLPEVSYLTILLYCYRKWQVNENGTHNLGPVIGQQEILKSGCWLDKNT